MIIDFLFNILQIFSIFIRWLGRPFILPNFVSFLIFIISVTFQRKYKQDLCKIVPKNKSLYTNITINYLIFMYLSLIEFSSTVTTSLNAIIIEAITGDTVSPIPANTPAATGIAAAL